LLDGNRFVCDPDFWSNDRCRAVGCEMILMLLGCVCFGFIVLGFIFAGLMLAKLLK
jgi:hypothetical protein